MRSIIYRDFAFPFSFIFFFSLCEMMFAQRCHRGSSIDYRGILRYENILTSGSASRNGNPTTNTKFFCTTLTFARCFRFSITFCFRCWSFNLFSAFILKKKNTQSVSYVDNEKLKVSGEFETGN